jgi:maltooligosyltrehalose trehalohydrolase
MPPLLFMGEEWGAAQPFPFFCDFPEPLATAVCNGRREEFRAAYAERGDAIPDPLAEATFRSAVLDWGARSSPAGQRRLRLVRELLAVRRREIAPHLAGAKFGAARCDDKVLTANWSLGDGTALILLANLSDADADMPAGFQSGRPIWGGEPTDKLAPWTVFWSIGAG